MPPTLTGIDDLNTLDDADARRALSACCSAPQWVDRMVSGRPYGSIEELRDASDRAVADMTAADLDEALAGHPRIGDRVQGAGTEWSQQEQSSVSSASADVAIALAEGNHAYEERFGRVYLVSAAGKSADEMLAILRGRLRNDPSAELDEVRTQLAAINRLRLTKLVMPS